LTKKVWNTGEAIRPVKFESVGWNTHHGLVAAEISLECFSPVISM
jgi:hypothetical protein